MDKRLFYTDILNTILEYTTQTDRSFLKMSCKEYYKDIRFGKKLKMNLYDLITKEQILWAKDQNYKKVWRAVLCESFALKGDLEMLKWLRDPTQHNEICKWNQEACIKAAKGGHLHILKWLRQSTPKCPWNAGVCCEAVRNRHLDILMWARSQKPPCPWNCDLTRDAIESGHIEIVKWLYTNYDKFDSSEVCYYAARYNKLDILLWGIKMGFMYDEFTCREATKGGHLEILKFLRGYYTYEGITVKCPWDKYTVLNAIMYDRKDILEWLRDKGSEYPFHLWEIESCKTAAFYNQLEILKWLRSPYKNLPPCKWSSSVCSVAAEYGYIEILKWALPFWKDKLEAIYDVWHYSIKNEFKSICLWLCSEKYPLNNKLCEDIVVNNLFEVVKALREMNYECIEHIWNTRLYIEAIITENIEFIKWLHKGGENYPPCPLDKNICMEYCKNREVIRELIRML